MKIAHCSDLHLGKKVAGTKEFSQKRYEDFFSAFDKMADKVTELNTDVLIIAGDLFDKREIGADTLKRTEEIFKKIIFDENNNRRNIDILVIDGNHDISSSHNDSWINYLEQKSYIKYSRYNKEDINNCKVRIKDINFYLVGYHGFMIDSVMKNLAEQLDAHEKNIVVAHTAIFNNFNLPGLINTETVNEFRDRVLYMAGGHIHSYSKYPKDNPFFFVPGSLEFTNVLNESSDNKGFLFFNTELNDVKFIEVKHRKRLRTKIFKYDINMNLEEKFSEFLSEYKFSGNEMVIVPIECDYSDYINTQKLEDIANNFNIFKCYFEFKMKGLDYTVTNSDDINVSDMRSSIEKNIIDEWNFLKNKGDFSEILTQMKKFQSDDDRESFFSVFDKFLNDNFICGEKNEN